MSFFNDCFFGGFFRAVQIVGGPQCDEQWHQARHCEQYTDCGSCLAVFPQFNKSRPVINKSFNCGISYDCFPNIDLQKCYCLTWMVVFSWHSSFLRQENWPPRYNWNIVESSVKHHNHNLLILAQVAKIHVRFSYLLASSSCGQISCEVFVSFGI
jgi:hypothetical protein